MASETFYKVMPHVFASEGGYVDHPADPGGATNLGITIATLARYRGRPVSKAEVKALDRAEAQEIYRENYWKPIKGDDLPEGVDYAVFDFAINSGVSRAVRALQKVVGVPQDGVIGLQTLAAVRKRSKDTVIRALSKERLAFMRRLKTWKTFGTGWQRRVNNVQMTALRMGQGMDLAALTVLDEASTETATADPRDRKVTSTKQGGANVTTMVGAIGAGASEMASQVSLYTEIADILKYAFVALTIVGALAGLYVTVKKIQTGDA